MVGEELKDYIDLYFFLKEKVLSLDEMIKLAKEKYQWEFSEKLFWNSYFWSTVGSVKLSILGSATIPEINDFFKKLVKEKMEADKSKVFQVNGIVVKIYILYQYINKNCIFSDETLKMKGLLYKSSRVVLKALYFYWIWWIIMKILKKSCFLDVIGYNWICNLHPINKNYA